MFLHSLIYLDKGGEASLYRSRSACLPGPLSLTTGSLQMQPCHLRPARPRFHWGNRHQGSGHYLIRPYPTRAEVLGDKLLHEVPLMTMPIGQPS